jgi:hypothetical protein
MSDFTPAPWHAVDGSRGRLLICARAADQDTAIAECFARRMSSNGPYPVEQNRRLMLAAPDLYEILDAMHGTPELRDYLHSNWAGYLLGIEAALMKARGEA